MKIKYINMFHIIVFLLILSYPFGVFADDEQFYSLISKLEQSTVMIYFENEAGMAIPLASGFVASADGLVVTANHVVRKADDDGVLIKKDSSGNIIKAEINYLSNIYCKFSDNTMHKVAVLSDKELLKKENKPYIYDYAILKIVGATTPFNYLEMSDYSAIQVGSSLLFAGFPLSNPNITVHRGMVSAKYSDYAFGNNKMLAKMIQIDGSVNKGNSGGPVVDIKDGKVIGIINTRYVGITTKLFALRKQIMAGMKVGSIQLINTDPNEAILELINILDRNMSVGIGQAIAINYIKDEMNLIKQTAPNNKPKD